VQEVLLVVQEAVEREDLGIAHELLQEAVVRYPHREELIRELEELTAIVRREEEQRAQARATERGRLLDELGNEQEARLEAFEESQRRQLRKLSEEQRRRDAEQRQRLEELENRVSHIVDEARGVILTETELQDAISAALGPARQMLAATPAEREIAQQEYPGEFRDLLEEGMVALEAGEPERARTQLERAVALNPAHPEANSFLAAAIYESRSADAGQKPVIRHARRAVKEDPNQTLAHVTLARAYLRENDPALAEAEYREAVSSDPRSIEARYELGLLLLRKGESGQALAQFRSVLDLEGTNTAARYYAASALAELGRREEALTELKRVRRVDPANVAVHMLAAELQKEAGDYEAALSAYSRADEVRSGWRFRLGMAESLDALGREREAREAYLASAARNPAASQEEQAAAVRTYTRISELYLETGEFFLEALRAAERGLEVSPQNTTLLRLAGRAATEAGRRILGEQYFEQLEELQRDYN